MHGFGTLEAHLLGRLLHGFLRKSHKLFDIPHRSLDVHVRNIETQRGELNRYHFLCRGRVFAILFNIKRTPKETKGRPRRCRNQVTLRIETPIEIREKSMPDPTGVIRHTGICVEACHGAFGRAKMPFACVHVLICII
jgi:hypothetical protein